MLTDDAGRAVRRRYTVTKVDPVAGTLVLDGVLHGDGPGARWFAAAQPGDEVDAFGPRSGIELVRADWYLLCSDESGLPAVSELATRLAGPVIGLLEVGDAGEEQRDIAQPDPGASMGDHGQTGANGEAEPMSARNQRAQPELHWLHRNAGQPGRPDEFAAAINRLAWPAGAGYAYVLGESRAVTALKPVLAGAGFAADRCYVKGYWNRPR